MLTSIQSSQNSNPSSQSIDQLEGTPGKLAATEQVRTALACLVHPAPQPVISRALCLQRPEAGPGPSQDLTGIGCLSPTSKLNVSAFSYQVETPSPGYNTLTSWGIHDFPYESDFQTLVRKRTTWGLVKMQTLGHTFSFSFSKSGAGPKNLHFNKFPGDAGAVTISGDYIENCCPRGKETLLLCQNIAPKIHSST